jgi:hypothetical protein
MAGKWCFVMEKTLVFVYNAKSGLFNKLTDFAHKLISPNSYTCNLCAITYSEFGMRNEWKEFLNALNLQVDFHYKDIFQEDYGMNHIELPAILLKNSTQLDLIVDATAINSCHNLADLKNLILSKIS